MLLHIHAVLADVLPTIGSLLPLADDPTPEPEDVKAGWTAFAIFLALGVAVALLGWALTKQLKRTEANRKAGAFGPVDDAEEPRQPGEPGETGDRPRDDS